MTGTHGCLRPTRFPVETSYAQQKLSDTKKIRSTTFGKFDQTAHVQKAKLP